MQEQCFEFAGPVELIDCGRVSYSVVYLPAELCASLPLKAIPRLRIEAEVSGFGIKAAIQPTSAGEYYVLLSKRVLKGAGLDVGDQALVRFCIDDQDAVEVPQALQFAIEASVVADAEWRRLTPGKRRGLVHRINTAKTEKTRSKRIEELIEWLCESAEGRETQ